jgi:hypothetical protein
MKRKPAQKGLTLIQFFDRFGTDEKARKQQEQFSNIHRLKNNSVL